MNPHIIPALDSSSHLSLLADDVFSDVNDPAWVARLSLPLAADYHDNIFVPDGPLSPESELPPRDGLDSSSFSTFGKIQRTLFSVDKSTVSLL